MHATSDVDVREGDSPQPERHSAAQQVVQGGKRGSLSVGPNAAAPKRKKRSRGYDDDSSAAHALEQQQGHHSRESSPQQAFITITAHPSQTQVADRHEHACHTTEGPEAAIDPDDADIEPTKDLPANTKRKVLSKKKLERYKKQAERRGVVYVSRIPPHMKPQKLKQLLGQYGAVNRVYCAPEDEALRRARKTRGGNTGKNFTEGWVEFEDKRVAKRVALMLNGHPTGGSKRSAYHYDLWCLKYLPKFKWDHLTEQIRYERAVREQKLGAEVAAARRERDFYLSRVDKAKAVDAIAQRRQQPQRQEDKPAANEGGSQPQDSTAAAAADRKLLRVYGQKRTKADPVLDSTAGVADDVLALIARRRSKTNA